MAVGRIDVVLSANSQAFIDGMTRSQAAAQATADKVAVLAEKVNNVTLKVAAGGFALGEIMGRVGADISKASAEFVKLTGSSSATLEQLDQLTNGIAGISTSIGTASIIFNGFFQVTQLGMVKLSGLFPAMGAKIAALAGPIGLTIAGVAALGTLVYTQFDNISNVLRITTNAFIRLYNNFLPLRVVSEALYQTFNIVFSSAKTWVENIIIGFKGLGTIISQVANGEVNKIGETLKNTTIAIKLNTDSNSRELGRSIQASIARIKGDVKLKELSPEEWEAKIAGPVRKFLRIKPTQEVDVKVKDGKVKEAVERLAFTVPVDLKVRALGDNFKVFSQADTIVSQLGTSFSKLDQKFKFTGDTAGLLRAKINEATEALQQLALLGLAESDVRVIALQGRLAGLNTELDNLSNKTQNISITDVINNLSAGFTEIDAKFRLLGQTNDLVSSKIGEVNEAISQLGQTPGIGEANGKVLELRTSLAITEEKIAATQDALQQLGLQTGIEESDIRVQALRATLSGLLGDLDNLKNASIESANEIAGVMIDLSQTVNEGVQTLLVDSFNAIGESLAGVLTGSQNASTALGSVVSGMFSTIGGIIQSLGRTILSAGLGIEALKKSLTAFTGIGAIAAGVGLIALGALVKSSVGSLGSGAKAFAKGGAVSGPTFALVGDNPNAAFDNEVIQPESKLRKLLTEVLQKNSGNAGNVNLNLNARLGHRQLALAVENGNYQQNRVR